MKTFLILLSQPGAAVTSLQGACLLSSQIPPQEEADQHEGQRDATCPLSNWTCLSWLAPATFTRVGPGPPKISEWDCGNLCSWKTSARGADVASGGHDHGHMRAAPATGRAVAPSSSASTSAGVRTQPADEDAQGFQVSSGNSFAFPGPLIAPPVGQRAPGSCGLPQTEDTSGRSSDAWQPPGHPGPQKESPWEAKCVFQCP